MSASQHRLDCDTIATPDAPAARGLVTDLLDVPDRLMTRDHRIAQPKLAESTVILLDVAAAHTARLEPQQPRVGADLGELKFIDLNSAVVNLHRCTSSSHRYPSRFAGHRSVSHRATVGLLRSSPRCTHSSNL